MTSTSGSSERMARGLYAVHNGHEEVHQDHVGFEVSGKGQGLLAVCCLPDHLYLGVEREEHPQALAHHAVIVGYQDPYRHDYFSLGFGPELSPRRRRLTTIVPSPDVLAPAPPLLPNSERDLLLLPSLRPKSYSQRRRKSDDQRPSPQDN